MPDAIWQPVVLIIPQRLDCGQCRARAVFVVLNDEDEPLPARPDDADERRDMGFSAWCQPCWEKALESGDVA